MKELAGLCLYLDNITSWASDSFMSVFSVLQTNHESLFFCKYCLFQYIEQWKNVSIILIGWYFCAKNLLSYFINYDTSNEFANSITLLSSTDLIALSFSWEPQKSGWKFSFLYDVCLTSSSCDVFSMFSAEVA